MYINCSAGNEYCLEWNDFGKYYVCFVNDVNKLGKSFPVFSNLVNNTRKLKGHLETSSLEFIYHQPSDSLQIIFKQEKSSTFLQQGSVNRLYNANYIENLLEKDGNSAVDMLVGIRGKTLVHEPVMKETSDINLYAVLIIIIILASSIIFKLIVNK